MSLFALKQLMHTRSMTQQTLSFRACDVFYPELIDGRYPRTLKDLPGPQVPLCVESDYGFWDWLDDVLFPSRVEGFRK